MAANEEGLIRNYFTWSSDQQFQLSTFIDLFKLPQFVKVAEGEGIYSTSEDDTLPSGQILILHAIQVTELYYGNTYEGKEVFLPLNCKDKVEIRPQTAALIYETVEELCDVFPKYVKYVRTTKAYIDDKTGEQLFGKGTKLKLEYLLTENVDNPALICINDNGCEVVLSMDVSGGFEPLASDREYFLHELVDKLPVYVQFINEPSFAQSSRYKEKHNVAHLSGVIQLKSVTTEETIIASTKLQGKMNILTIPKNLQVSVMLPRQSYQTNADVCKYLLRLNNKINAAKLEVSYTVGKTIDLQPYPAQDERGRDDEEDDAYLMIDDDGQDVFILSPPTKKSDEIQVATSRTRLQRCLTTIKEYCCCCCCCCLRKRDKATRSKGNPPLPQRDVRLQLDKHNNAGFSQHAANDNAIADMNVNDVTQFLDNLGMTEFSELFRREQVNGSLLLEIDMEMLREHFKMNQFEALKLFRAVSNYRTSESQ